jgi:hypothetical protein
MEVDATVLNDTPAGTMVAVDLVEPGAGPFPHGFKDRLLYRFEMNDRAPAIVVSLFDTT